MADEINMQKKPRSASIGGTSGSSLENAIHALPTGSRTPDNAGTPNTYRRRRPATRTQSARITNTAAKSVRRKVQMHHQTNLQESRSHCTSEPKLSETETPPQRRKLSQRRPQQHPHRKSNAFLDVPTSNMQHLRVSNDEDLDRLRTFSASKGGIINRGDSFRRRRSRSNSLVPVSPIHPRAGALAGCTDYDVNSHEYQQHQHHHHQKQQQHQHHQQQQQQDPVDIYHVDMLGAAGVGKQALISQFRTSDCINAYDGPECDEGEQNISIILNNIESELKFCINKQESKDELEKADAFVVVYSCVDKESFTRCKQILSRLQDMDLLRTRPIILVANKIDLARSRSVSAQDGKCLACTFGAKFIEVSVGINHNCDELLAGTLTQIRLKKDQNLLQPKLKSKLKSKTKDKHNHHFDHHVNNHDNHESSGEKFSQDKKQTESVMGNNDSSASPAHWYKSRSVMMASMKARQMLTWILGKEDSKFKNCENLQVL